jgi:hypothetical protein
VIMVTATIMKDTGGSTDSVYRPNAIRALCRIIDVGAPLCLAGTGTGVLPLWGRGGANMGSTRPPPSSLSSVS